MSRLKRVGLILGLVLVASLALIGALTITRGTQVSYVATLDDSGPPAVND